MYPYYYGFLTLDYASDKSPRCSMMFVMTCDIHHNLDFNWMYSPSLSGENARAIL
jgi:hypothetical protein